MPLSATLALGQTSYNLLEVLDVDQKVVASITSRASTQTLAAVKRGGEISGINIQSDGTTSLNVTDRSSELFYSETPDALINSNINLLANSNLSAFDLGNGDNRFNAARDLTNSQVMASGGNDNIRIGGSADGSSVYTGDGDDRFTANRGSDGLWLNMGAGADTILFLGTLTTGLELTPISENPVYERVSSVELGTGDDSATFLGGVQGDVNTLGNILNLIDLGFGDDTVVFGANSNSNKFFLDTGSGSDMVTLGRTTTNAYIDLGWDNGFLGYMSPDNSDTTVYRGQGDYVILGVGSTLANSTITSEQSWDELRLAGTVTDTTLDLGWGYSEIDVDGVVAFSDSTFWELAGGNDKLTFNEFSDISLLGDDGYGYFDLGSGSDSLSLLGTGFGGWSSRIEFDLGDSFWDFYTDDSILEDGDNDTVNVGLNSSYSGILISNFGEEDVLIIGESEYDFDDIFNSGNNFDDDLSTFLASGNTIRSSYYGAPPF